MLIFLHGIWNSLCLTQDNLDASFPTWYMEFSVFLIIESKGNFNTLIQNSLYVINTYVGKIFLCEIMELYNSQENMHVVPLYEIWNSLYSHMKILAQIYLCEIWNLGKSGSWLSFMKYWILYISQMKIWALTFIKYGILYISHVKI